MTALRGVGATVEPGVGMGVSSAMCPLNVASRAGGGCRLFSASADTAGSVECVVGLDGLRAVPRLVPVELSERLDFVRVGGLR